MPNRLSRETSPYLLQHAENPVEWYPWGEEALARARREDRPIFLSLGYSACHWCHVMAHESFEDEETARLMNESFVNIKVDREERPDLDGLYMQAVQALTGQGGWPMSVWLTPDLRPFFGGTYFPREPRYGMPSFKHVLQQLAGSWRDRRDDVARAASELTEALERMSAPPEPRPLEGADEGLLEVAFRSLRSTYDAYHGGFGSQPKFPAPMNLGFLYRYWRHSGNPAARDMVENTLRKMARGGIYDQLGGGFHRYSVDAEWAVPHFEKMLYDNAQLARVYVEAWQGSGEPFFRSIAEETLDYLLREMTSPEGGFYSTQDADSEGEEGRFFVWTPEAVKAVLGEEDGRVACELWGVSATGNFEHGATVLHRARDEDVAAHLLGMRTAELQERLPALRRRLFEAREARVHPGRDEKILAAWNGLALRAFAEAALAFGDGRYLEAARRNANFLLERMSQPDGRLFRSFKDGEARFNAYMEDYACVAEGLLSLYQADPDRRWADEARRLMDLALDRFWDEEGETFWVTDREHEPLVARPRDLLDNATPAGNNVAVANLVRLGHLTGEPRYQEIAARALKRLAGTVRRAAAAFGSYLEALDLHLHAPDELTLVGERGSAGVEAFLRVIGQRFLPHRLVALADPRESEPPAIPLLEGKTALGGAATCYLCRGAACRPPMTDPRELEAELDR